MCAILIASAPCFSLPRPDGSNTTKAPRAHASAASVSAARDSRSRKNTEARASDDLIPSAALSVTGLKAGSDPPQCGQDQENRCSRRPPGPRRIRCTMIGAGTVGLQPVQSRQTPHRPISARMRSDAASWSIRAIGYASHPRYARIDSTLPQVPPVLLRIGVSGSGPITRSSAIRPVPKILDRLPVLIPRCCPPFATQVAVAGRRPLLTIRGRDWVR